MSQSNSALEAREYRRKDQIYKVLKEPNSVKRYFFRRTFKLFEALGIHITADHFYEPIPNLKLLNERWSADRRDCIGIDFHQLEAEEFALRIFNKYGPEFSGATTKAGFHLYNSYYTGIDALSLYCFVRETKPNKVIEIGAGASTRVLLAALHANAEETGVRPELLSVDPYSRFSPEEKLNVAFSILPEALQDVESKVAGQLESGDLLFIDSTHVYKFGSDVESYFERIFPNINAGVNIHMHDIFSPFYYPKYWMTDAKRFWNEQFFLESFLMFNNQFQVILPTHLLMRESEPLRALAREIIAEENKRYYLGQTFFFKRVDV